MTDVSSPSEVMEILGKQDMQFPTNQEIGEESIHDVLSSEPDSDMDETSRIGSMVISMTGGPKSISVPHDELVEKMESLGFPESAIPSRISSGQAFTRAKNELKEELPQAYKHDGTNLTFSLWSESRFCKHVVGEYITEEANTHTLGKIQYDSDSCDVKTTMNTDFEDTDLASFWKGTVVPSINSLFEKHKQRHNGKDIADMKRTLEEKSVGSIKLRRAVYFYPATTENFDEVLESFRQLYNWLNNYKQRGGRAEFFYTPLFNRKADRDLISAKLEENLREEMEALIQEVGEELSEDDNVETLAKNVLSPALNQMDNKIEQYEAISETTPKLKRLIDDILDDVDPETEKRAKKVIQETTDKETVVAD